jgi:hypothetical protein
MDYHATVFIGMWYPEKSLRTIEKLVISSEPRSGFQRMVTLGLKQWTLEAAVLKCPDSFSKEANAYAKARMEGILDA